MRCVDGDNGVRVYIYVEDKVMYWDGGVMDSVVNERAAKF